MPAEPRCARSRLERSASSAARTAPVRDSCAIAALGRCDAPASNSGFGLSRCRFLRATRGGMAIAVGDGEVPAVVPSTRRRNSMLYAAPGTPGAKVQFKPVYENFINGKFVPPVRGQTFDVISPINGKVFTKAARSTAEDIELALDAAH